MLFSCQQVVPPAGAMQGRPIARSCAEGSRTPSRRPSASNGTTAGANKSLGGRDSEAYWRRRAP